MTKTCTICNETKPLAAFNKHMTASDGKTPQCRACDNARKLARHHKKIIRLKETFGGKCQLCGYDKCFAALDFHHIGPKEFEVTMRRRSYENMLAEAQKCILVCANCHRALHHCPE